MFRSRILCLTVILAGASFSGAGRTAEAAAAVNHVHSILILPSNPNVIYLGAHFRLYKSTDGGKRWHGLLNQMMLSMALDPAHPGTMWGITLQSGFLKSTDGGLHWSAPRSRPTKGQASGVTYDPSAKVILAYGVGIYRSGDGGSHWTVLLKDASIYNIAVGANSTEYASSGNGLYVSHDGGKHWNVVASIGSQPILQTVAAGQVAYAIGPISLMKSTNDGRTWKTLATAPVGLEFLGISPKDPNEVIGEISGRGFVVTHNGGASWQTANSGIHDRNFSASTVRVAPSSPKVAYTGAWGLHFYATHDGGRKWTLVASLTK